MVRGVGLVTGWGEGVGTLPVDAARAADPRRVVPIARPPRDGDRYRRATDECLLGIRSVERLLVDLGWSRDRLAGADTALVYVTAGAYGASNRQFLEAAGAGTLHFPYTAPSAVPAEVAIEFGLTGPYTTLIGGAAATIDALWQAALWLERGRCRRALVLAVETFVECADLYERARWLVGRPLVEAAGCALLEPGPAPVRREPLGQPALLETRARTRAGETLACGPLVALALARDERPPVVVSGEWRGRRAALEWGA